MKKDNMMTVAEVAIVMRVEERTVRNLIKSKRLKAINIGTGNQKYWRINPADLINLK